MRRAALPLVAALALSLAGCGTSPRDPGDAQARRVLALAAHERELADRAVAAARTHERLVLQELLTEARLAQEDIEATVPFGAPGRSPALEGAREVVRAAELLHSYVAGHPAALRLARRHVDAAARALAGAAGAVEPHISDAAREALRRLRVPAPAV